MELIDTVVHRNTSDNLVEFVGEGGEVTIASSYEGKADDELVETAKLMMVQIVAFERPELGVPIPPRRRLVRHFRIRGKGIIRVMPGISLPNLQAVQDEVNRSAEDLWKYALDKSEGAGRLGGKGSRCKRRCCRDLHLRGHSTTRRIKFALYGNECADELLFERLQSTRR